MARNRRQRRTTNTGEDFRFIRITDDASYLDKIAAGLGDSRTLSVEHHYALCDGGWKLSFSQHQSHGYYIAAITDKLGRPGCDKRVFLFEHNSLETAIRAAIFCATELLAEGYGDDGDDGVNREW